MSVTDFEIDEDDGEYCSLHNHYRPCGGCAADLADRQFDSKREDDAER